MGPEAEWRHDSRKLRSFFDRDGCRSLRSALASIWRIRSRVTAKSCPTSSSVLAAVGQPEAQPQHLLLARRERVEHLVRLLTQREAADGVDGRDALRVS